MKHRVQQQLRHNPARRRYLVAGASAAFVAAALTTGLLVSQSQARPERDAAPVTVADLANPGSTQPAQSGGQGGLGPAPATSAPPSPTAAATKAPSTTIAEVVSKPKPKPKPPSAKVLDYEYQAQINGYYCGPAATRIALTARGRHPSQDAVAAELGTTVNGTNSAEDTTRGLNSLGDTNFYQTTSIPGPATPGQVDRLQADVVHAVSSGYAVVANIVGSATDTDGGWHEYDGGHYLTVVGYRDSGRTVQIADPAYVNGVSSYWMSTSNLANWMGTRGYSA